MTLRQPSDFDFNQALKRISGDEQDARIAFRDLHNFFGGVICATARKHLKSKELADDLVQELFTDIWVRRKRLSHVLNFEGYLIRMTKLLALNILRRSINTELLERKHLEMMESQGELLPAEYSDQLDKIVELLPSPRKQIFRLSKIQGLAGKVIADQFQIPLNQVHWHVSQAVKFIKERRHDVISVVILCITFFQPFH